MELCRSSTDCFDVEVSETGNYIVFPVLDGFNGETETPFPLTCDISNSGIVCGPKGLYAPPRKPNAQCFNYVATNTTSVSRDTPGIYRIKICNDSCYGVHAVMFICSSFVATVPPGVQSIHTLEVFSEQSFSVDDDPTLNSDTGPDSNLENLIEEGSSNDPCNFRFDNNILNSCSSVNIGSSSEHTMELPSYINRTLISFIPPNTCRVIRITQSLDHSSGEEVRTANPKLEVKGYQV